MPSVPKRKAEGENTVALSHLVDGARYILRLQQSLAGEPSDSRKQAAKTTLARLDAHAVSMTLRGGGALRKEMCADGTSDGTPPRVRRR